MDEPQQRPSLFQRVMELPLAQLALFLTAGGLLFNEGYFLIVGIQFFSAFSIQEHLIFSIKGAAPILAIVVVGAVAVITKRLHADGQRRAAVAYALLVFLTFAAALAFIAAADLRNFAFVAVLLLFAGFGAVQLWLLRGPSWNPMFGTAAALSLSVSLGAAFGFTDLKFVVAPSLTISDQREPLVLLRVGQNFVLAKDAQQHVYLIPTSRVIDVEQSKTP